MIIHRRQLPLAADTKDATRCLAFPTCLPKYGTIEYVLMWLDESVLHPPKGLFATQRQISYSSLLVLHAYQLGTIGKPKQSSPPSPSPSPPSCSRPPPSPPTAAPSQPCPGGTARLLERVQHKFLQPQVHNLLLLEPLQTKRPPLHP